MRQLIGLILCALISSTLYAEPPGIEQFNQIFSEWTDAFNHKELDKSCALFSKSVTANYQGALAKDYSTICASFASFFADPKQQYSYQFKLNHVYCSNTLCAVQITWYLKTYLNEKLISITQDEGMDIFIKEKNQWKIINYLAYEYKPPWAKWVR